MSIPLRSESPATDVALALVSCSLLGPVFALASALTGQVKVFGLAAACASLVAPLAVVVATLTLVVRAVRRVPWSRRTSLAFWAGWFSLGLNVLTVPWLFKGA